MAHEVTMPQMGYDMTEGTINEWRVKEGDKVSRGDAIASIATDKADIDIEAYADGVLRKIVAQPGQTVPVGAVIAWIGEPDEAIPDAGGAAQPPASEDEQERRGSRPAARRGVAGAEKTRDAEQAAAQAKPDTPSVATARLTARYDPPA